MGHVREATAGREGDGGKHPAKFLSFVPKSFNFSREEDGSDDEDDDNDASLGLIMKPLTLSGLSE